MRTTLIILSMLAFPALLSAQTVWKREYFPDGQVSKISWATDDLVYFISYHENGKVHEKGSFLEGKKNGRWIQFDAQGHRIARVKFDHGQRSGVWVLRTLDGLNHRLHYREDKLVRGEEYDPQGVLVAVRDAR